MEEPVMNKQSARFFELLDSIKELHDKKRHDYGANEDVFANFRLSELSGIPAWQGSVVRMGDKYARMSNFIKKGEFKFKEESIKDTLQDMAIYSLITLILFEEAEYEKSIRDDINRDCDLSDDSPPDLSYPSADPMTDAIKQHLTAVQEGMDKFDYSDRLDTPREVNYRGQSGYTKAIKSQQAD